MARTITEILASIQQARANTPALAEFKSNSATSLMGLWSYITAVVHWAHEVLWDQHKADVDATLARAKPGTAGWYAEQALLFQEGDTLVADDAGIHYLAGSTGAKIITRAVAIENELSGKLFIKVATDGPTPGTLAALTPAQLTQVRGYFDRKGFAGVRKEVVSRAADRLKVEAEVYYDPLINVPALQLLVQAAVQRYLANLEFNGLVYLARIEDAIQSVPGVKDVKLVRVSARAGAGAPKVISRFYETEAGYIVTDEAAGSTLVDTLQFLPHA
ncbi:baseplate J/gp47 family protein [Hymenobacter metallicola]|uniref:Baseplate J-like C-terminal domain-containing protein n=1 Tax=Hymenobacter metallicola TaxID=2563114 RepID=A0A4Z0Q346_9BACT|nr:hypothetical protein [Hymenobacter metallicola]TGE23563.1 hypothetical protein E5K02_20470 [Hymenobacter metallicola]